AASAYGAADPALTARYSGFVHGETLATSGVTGSPVLATAATGSPPGTYAIAAGPGSLRAANYDFAFANGTLTITPAPLTPAGADVTAAVAAPFSGVVASFANADPFGGPASYAATISWGDGTNSAGVISDAGRGTFQVSGSHTYAGAGAYAVSVL